HGCRKKHQLLLFPSILKIRIVLILFPACFPHHKNRNVIHRSKKHKMNLMRNSSIWCRILLFNCVVLSACHSADKNANKKNTAAEQAGPPAVEIFAVQKGRLSSSLQVPGELVAFQQV